ncbi:ogr/Delta-like zinc finger family protein [Azospirillum argentinense]
MRHQAFANGTNCPVCGTRCSSIRADQLTPQVREVTYLCRNPKCTCQFVASIAPVRVIMPSQLPPTAALQGTPTAFLSAAQPA